MPGEVRSFSIRFLKKTFSSENAYPKQTYCPHLRTKQCPNIFRTPCPLEIEIDNLR